MLSDRGFDHSKRDLPGYGQNTPDPKWPGGAKLAISFVLNYEEGGENCLLNGDSHAESFLTEGGAATTVMPPREGRNLGWESQYEYGAHRGFWRILDLFRRHQLRFTCWAIGKAVENNPQVVPAMEEAGCEVASHSYRWIDYDGVEESEERKHIELTIDAIRTASKHDNSPLGWYTGRDSMATRRLVYDVYRERGILDKLYDNDAYDEDLPYWVNSPAPSPDKPSPPLLVIPYTFDNNDMKFAQAPGFFNANAYFEYLRDAFDVLYAEGQAGSPKMMTVAMHCRVVGRPGRFLALQKFLDHIRRKDVWIATRTEIAEHWRKVHPAPAE